MLGLVLLEAGLHVLLGNFGQSKLLQHSDNAEVCLELRPRTELTYTGWRARVPATTMRTNSYGIRGPEFSFDKRPGTIRIATVGDSFTFGQGVEEDEAFVQVAGRRLTEHGLKAEVLNFGVPGHGTPQSVALVKHKVLATKPDVVLINVFPNDLTDEESYCVYGKSDSEVARFVLQNVYVGRLLFFLGGPVFRPKLEPGTRERLGTPGDRYVASMKELVALGAEHGFKPAAVMLTDRSQYRESQWCQDCPVAHDLMGETGIHMVDMGPAWALLQKDVGANFIAGDDHFTVAGNRAVGEALGDALAPWLKR
ncbi:MAG: SGNH/GDSL hydrolase family protein [Proteobacteria bacterium]|nr:SGNH/GDSL hydrolase family protein [Pseudomonadota bacterium]